MYTFKSNPAPFRHCKIVLYDCLLSAKNVEEEGGRRTRRHSNFTLMNLHEVDLTSRTRISGAQHVTVRQIGNK